MDKQDERYRSVSSTVVDIGEERILLGHITGVSGLKGWVKVHSDTSPRENITAYAVWWLEQSGNWRKVRVLGGRPQGKTIVAQIEGFDSPEQSFDLIGAKIAIERDALPALAAGEYYWADLAGMQVRTVDDVAIGTVSRLFETGANDVVVIKDEREVAVTENVAGSTSREVLVPWLVPDVVKDVDMESRVITVDWDPDF